MTKANNKPIRTFRDGALKASIWLNEHEERVFYTVSFSRSFKKENGEYSDAYSYSGADLLRLAQLAERAHAEILSMSALDREIDLMRDDIRQVEPAGAA